MTSKEQVLEIIKGEIYLCPSSKTDVIEELNKLIQYVTSEIQEPKIKQLVWGDRHIATVLEREIVYQIIEDEYKKYYIEINGGYIAHKRFKTPNQAKAYAQEHFEGLIRGCYE